MRVGAEQGAGRLALPAYKGKEMTRRLVGAELRGTVFDAVRYGQDVMPLRQDYKAKADLFIGDNFNTWVRTRRIPTETSPVASTEVWTRRIPTEELPAAQDQEALRIFWRDVRAAKAILVNKGLDGLGAAARREKQTAADLAHELGMH